MRVVLADDDTLAAVSLKTILEAENGIVVVGMGSHGGEAADLYEKEKPDILLMDIRMETVSGIEAAKQVLSRHPEAKIIFLTTFSDDEYIIQALGMGVKGYLLKQNFEGIVPALKAVLGGQTVFGDGIAGKLPSFMNAKGKFDYGKYGIGEKEQTVIEAVALGLSNKEIAEKLYFSEGTVRNYVRGILEKLGLRDRTQLAVFYYRNRDTFWREKK